MSHISLFLKIFVLTSQLSGPAMDPEIEWKTISTEHFKIHFDPKTETAAQKLAGISEDVWKRITTKFAWEPSFPVHLILSDAVDEPNGMAIPIPYNHIFLFPIPPSDTSPLDYYDDWITTLLIHEFTHTTHIDIARGWNKIPRSILGRFWLPNAAQQQWAIEGIAEYNETYETTKGRGRSPFIDMFLRTASLENAFLSIDQATYWYHQYPYGNAAYWYGIGFHNYLREKYGDQKIFDFANANGESLVPSFFNFKTDDIFGKSFARLWDEWKEAEREKALRFKAQHSPRISTEVLSRELSLLGRPLWSEDGNTLYASMANEEHPQILAWRKNDRGEWISEVLLDGKGPTRLTIAQNHLIFSDLSTPSSYQNYYDLYALDLATKKLKRLTRGFRIRDPFAFKDSIYGVRNENFRAELVRIPLKIEEAPISEDTYPAKHEVLFQAPEQSSIAKPKVSSDGHYLAFSMRLEGAERDLYIYDLRTGKIESITQDNADDSDPEFSENSEYLYFSSTRVFSPGETKVQNIFKIDLSNSKIFQITDAVTGMNSPTLNRNRMALGRYSADGWKLEILENPNPLFELEEKGQIKGFEAQSLSPSWKYSATDYRVGDSLLPRFVAPFVFYTESDTLIALLTASRDPLSFHNWSGLAYYLSSPQRPGGALSYVYNGLRGISIFASAAAGITNYGKVLYSKTPSTPYIQIREDYYERNYRSNVGVTHNLWWNGEPTSFSFSHSLFFDRREPLLRSPDHLARGSGTIDFSAYDKGVIAGVQLSPHIGNQWGVSETFIWSRDTKQKLRSISPEEGQSIATNLEFSPKIGGSDFKQLVTSVHAKSFAALSSADFIAARLIAGMQWFDPLYQRTFSLGGTLGEGPLSSSGRRSYAMRGLSASSLEGEGALTASLEYRRRLLSQLPGFGTAPVWIKNLHMALFSDGGQAFLWKMQRTLSDILSDNDRKFAFDRFSWTMGAELRSDASFSYLPPLTARLGYGYVTALRGQWWLNHHESQIYFELGSSF